MKIGILSMQRVINYGSVLQAYSLKQLLEEISGAEVSFIDIDRSEIVAVHGNVSTTEDYVKHKSIISHPLHCVRKVKHKLLRQIYVKKIQDFQINTLHLDRHIKEEYDLTVIGSDEVFNADPKIYLQLYGKVKNAKNVVSYAAACGMAEVKNIKEKDKPLVSDALNNICYMSVRDSHTKEYVQSLYKGQIEMHVDPVLAGNLRYREHKPVKSRKYLVVYAYAERIHDTEEIEAIIQFAKKKNLKIVTIGGQQIWADCYLPLDPYRMLDYFYHADYVITDTFHGTVFSIINGCRFAVIKRKSNEHKIVGVLDSVGLSDRLVQSTCDIEQVLAKSIDYEKVNRQLDIEHQRTVEYLKKCIEIAKDN